MISIRAGGAYLLGHWTRGRSPMGVVSELSRVEALGWGEGSCMGRRPLRGDSFRTEGNAGQQWLFKKKTRNSCG